MNVERSIRRRTFLSRLSGLGIIGLCGQGFSMMWSSVARAGKPKPAAVASPVVPLGNVTAADFAPLVGTPFQVDLAKAGSTLIMLVQAQEIHRQLPPGFRAPPRQPFSLVFQGPGSIRLPQDTYHLLHPMIGAIDLFLVPIGQRGPISHYQAIFG
jgi:hypothetical protein